MLCPGFSSLGFVLEGGFVDIESNLSVGGSQSTVSLNLTADNLDDSGLVNWVSAVPHGFWAAAHLGLGCYIYITAS